MATSKAKPPEKKIPEDVVVNIVALVNAAEGLLNGFAWEDHKWGEDFWQSVYGEVRDMARMYCKSKGINLEI